MTEMAGQDMATTGQTNVTPVQGEDGSWSAELPITNMRGLHARAAAKFVKTVELFDAEVDVTRCGQTVSGSSIMGLMMLAAAQGCSIHLRCQGADAKEVMDALSRLIMDRFDEE